MHQPLLLGLGGMWFRVGAAEGIEIGPDAIRSGAIKNFDDGFFLLRRINGDLHGSTMGIHGVRWIEVKSLIGGILQLYGRVADVDREGNSSRMNRLDFLFSAEELHALEISLELQVGCTVAVAQAARKSRAEPFPDLGHDIDAKNGPTASSSRLTVPRGVLAICVLLSRVCVVGVPSVALLLGAFGAQAIFFFFAVIERRGGECDFKVSVVQVIGPGVEFLFLLHALQTFPLLLPQPFYGHKS